MRVAPYGDKGDDWLKVNLSRSRNPQVRPSTSTLIGRVIAEDANSQLLQKTDRLGFLENETFLNLQQFAMNTLEWVANFRLQTVEVKHEQVKREIKPKISEAKKNIEDIITTYIPEPKPREETLSKLEGYDKIREEQVDSLNEELQLYRSLATAGTTAAVFAHESGMEVNTLKGQIGILKFNIKQIISNQEYMERFSENFNVIDKVIDSIKNFARYPIHLLKRGKRTNKKINIHQVITEVIQLFDNFLNNASICVHLDKANDDPHIQGSITLIESVLINLITNSINAFDVSNTNIDDRKIIIRTEVFDNNLWLRFMDNALGIRDIAIEEIWLPGRTTTPTGTGLGLKIAKDSIIDLGGQIDVLANGEFGGAEFIIKLPLRK